MFKKLHKRWLSLLTAAAMVLSLFAGMGVPAQAAEKAPNYRNVMYYGDWSIWGGQGNFYPKDIPADQITHLNFAFLYFDKDGNLKFTDKDAATGAPVGMNVTWGAANAGLLNAFQILRAENPNLKIGISVGGWSKSNEFSRMTANDTARANFVSNITKFVKYNNMDFVDIDWEYPGANQYREPDNVDNQNDEGTIYASADDKDNYIKLMQDLRASLDAQGAELGKTYELSCALPAPSKKLEDGIDIKKLFEIIDFGNMMTYDMRGAWDSVSGHQTPLYGNPADPYYEAGYSVDQTVEYMLSQGAPAEKIVVGCAFYTRGWNQVDAEGTVPGMPGLFGNAAKNYKDADQTPSYGAVNEAPMKVGDGGRAGGVWSYNAIDTLKSRFPGIKEYWDDVAQAPYLYDEKTGAFFTYDNVRSVTLKAEYVKEHGLGGCISWMASQDKKTDSTKRDELTKAIKQGLYGSVPLKQYEIVAPKLDVDVKVEMFSENWGAMSRGYAITLKNNETKNESGEVLQLTELASETIKSPKLYITLKEEDKLSPSGYGCGTVTNEGKVVVVDLATVYDNQTIGQGASVIFQLASANPEANLENIEKIELAQRITSDGPEIGRQLIYGSESGEAPLPVDQRPVIYGVRDKEITVGDKYNAMDGITAHDKEDGDLTDKITVNGEVDYLKAGSYEVTYTVEDAAGHIVTEKAVITVAEKEVEPPVEPDPDPEPEPEPDPTDPPVDPNPEPDPEPEKPAATEWKSGTAYSKGAVVTYNGKTYEAKWWSQGEVPGASKWGAWKEVAGGTEEPDPEPPVDPNPDPKPDPDPTDPPVDPSVPEWNSASVYNGGAKVAYKGKIYTAQWWTQGEVPGSSEWGSWKEVK